MIEEPQDALPVDPADDLLDDLTPAELDVIRLSEAEAAIADPDELVEPSTQG